MKTLIYVFSFLLLLGSVPALADGMETFANFPEDGNQYKDGTFEGQDGSIWTYVQCRGDQVIEDETPCLGKNRDPEAEIYSGTISGGITVLNFDYMQAFSTSVSLDVYVNDVYVTTVTSENEQGVIKNTGDIALNFPGEFVIKFKQSSNSSGQVSIDNVSWIGGGAVLPEPSEYPADFTATATGMEIALNWADAGGTTLPSTYLIQALETSSGSSWDVPVDGTPVENDLDFSDGKAAKNVPFGAETFTFSGLISGKTYEFMIYPFTNSGDNIDYKTDGTVPEATATIASIVIIEFENFNDGFGNWSPLNIAGDQVWDTDNTYGLDDTPCAQMSGYDGQPYVNEDWLISPAIDMDNYNSEILTFYSAMNYTGPELQCLISTNWDGQSDPNMAEWTTLDVSWSTGGWNWTASGNIDISGYDGSSVYVAFKFTSTDAGSATWELDDIKITGEEKVGIFETEMENIHIYPNPVRDNLTIQTDRSLEISVYTIDGRLVVRNQRWTRNSQLTTHNLNPGFYLLHLTDVESGEVIIRKFIKE